MNHNLEQVNGACSREKPHLTTRGVWLVWISVGLLLAGIMLAMTVLIEIALFCLFLAPASIFICRLNLSRLRFRATMPTGVFNGENFDLKLVTENSKQILGSFDALISYRVARLNKEAFFAFVAPCGETEQTKVTRISKRGVYEGLWYEIRSAFPFGIAERKERADLDSRIVVYPQPRPPTYLPDILESGAGSGQAAGSATRDVTGDFRLMREYYPGDSPKLISWPASQRRRRLLVREMEQPEPQRFTVLFHSFQPPNVVLSRRSFENSLEILSGIFVHLIENGLPIVFLASFNNWSPVDIGADSQSQKKVFELLASAEMKTCKKQIDFTEILKPQFTINTSVMILSNTPLRFWQHMASGLRMPVFCADNTEGRAVALER